ncbi:MAG: LPS export ABC transporter permease LptG [Gammaproteobacteria bacterium]|nr:LPS export ABC transporter permease LptG [Gammaproteobacteria bacterium]
MIFTRYLAINIFKGTGLVLMILVSLSLFFTLIQQIDHLGKGQFGPWQFTQYLVLRAPAMIVDFMPLATLIGSILSLGSLASNGELIAFQSSGMPVRKFIQAVSQAAFMLALIAFVISDFVVPYSETTAREIKTAGISSRVSMQSRTGVWIKDHNNIIFIQKLFPNGNAKNIEIYQLDDQDKLLSTTYVRSAVTSEQGWLLQQLKRSVLSEGGISVIQKNKELYKGNLSEQLLQSLVVDPRQMSSANLYSYITFLQENKLNSDAESLSFWRKVYSPLTVMVMSILAIPFVLGSQRNNNTGQRIITGILLGLVFVIVDRVLIQLGGQMKLVAFVNAFIPTLLFMLFTAYLIRRKVMQS